jgi:hypothetical protein
LRPLCYFKYEEKVRGWSYHYNRSPEVFELSRRILREAHILYYSKRHWFEGSSLFKWGWRAGVLLHKCCLVKPWRRRSFEVGAKHIVVLIRCASWVPRPSFKRIDASSSERSPNFLCLLKAACAPYKFERLPYSPREGS